MNARATSIAAYNELRDSGRMSQQEATIYLVLFRCEKAMSLREIQRVTRIDINAVSGRVNGLKKRGLLVEHAKRRCSITGKMITPVSTCDKPAQGELFL